MVPKKGLPSSAKAAPAYRNARFELTASGTVWAQQLIDDPKTPLEAGLEWVVKFSKPDFIGRDVLLKQKERGVERKLVGLEMLNPGIARAGYPLFQNEAQVGHVTSGTQSPSLGKAIALGYVGAGHAAVGNVVDVEIRSRRIPAKIVSLPFYRR